MGRKRPLAAWVSVVARRPLRIETRDEGGTTAEERGFWNGPKEAAEEITASLGVEPDAVTAFGGRWFAARADGAIVAPGLPVVASDEEVLGPGGAYRCSADGAVELEGGGSIERLLEWRTTDLPPSIELLWFEETERCTVADGVLNIQDLFSRMRLPATRQRLEQQLVRRRRVAPAVLDGVAVADPNSAGNARLLMDSPPGAPPRPERVLAARLDLGNVRAEGNGFRAEHVGGGVYDFRVEHRSAGGWRMVCQEDPRGIMALTVAPGRIQAELAPGLDPLAAGLRTRLVFDLRADLTVAVQNV